MNKLSQHVLFSFHPAIKDICSPLEFLNIFGFIYIKRYIDGSFIDLSNQLEWSEFFLQNLFNCHYTIPDLQKHMLNERNTNLWLADPDNIIWQEGKKYFGFGNGISIVYNEEQYSEIFCFYSTANNYAINQFYFEQIDVLKKFCSIFKEKVAEDILRAEKNGNMLIMPSNYIEQVNPKVSTLTAADPNSKFLNLISDKEDNVDSLKQKMKIKKLSRREVDCIKLSAIGKSAKEIAKELNLSNRTVETYLSTAKMKYHCRNIKELIYKVSLNKIV